MQSYFEPSLFINTSEFEKAAIFAHRFFLSTPFTCPNPNRPYERAICLLANDRIVDVSVKPGCINQDGSVNLQQVEALYKSKPLKVVYRPNHELLHSLRQAAMVPKIKEYYDRNTPGKYDFMQPKHLERLQLMMLFSVSGRKDETGFHDSPEAREKFYLKYRSDSAVAFLEYAKKYPGLYGPGEEEQLYHDALMVELMGAPTIPTREEIESGNYEIVKRIKEKNYDLPNRLENFPGVYLDFMNTAHSLDLLRVYPPDSSDAANNKKNIEKFIGETLRFHRKEGTLTEDNIRNCIKDTISMLQYSRKMLDESGEKTTTMVDLDNKKIDKILNDPFLTQEINVVLNDQKKIDDVKKSISQFLTNKILQSGDYDYSVKRFNYCHYKGNSNLDKDRDINREVTSSISMLNSIARPKFAAGEQITADFALPATSASTSKAPAIPTLSTSSIISSIGPPMGEEKIVNIITAAIKNLNIVHGGQWKTITNNTSVLIEVGISNYSKNQAITFKDLSNQQEYQIEVGQGGKLIILDKTNKFATVNDLLVIAHICNTLLKNIPDSFKMDSPKASPTVAAPAPTVAAPAPSKSAPSTTAVIATPKDNQPIDYDAYLNNITKLLNDPEFLKGKVVHTKTKFIGDLLLPNARPSIITKIAKVMAENQGVDSQQMFGMIQTRVFDILEKTMKGKDTHNGHPDTVTFMKAATNVEVFKKYYDNINPKNNSTPQASPPSKGFNPT